MIKTILELMIVPYLWLGIFLLIVGNFDLGVIWMCGLVWLTHAAQADRNVVPKSNIEHYQAKAISKVNNGVVA